MTSGILDAARMTGQALELLPVVWTVGDANGLNVTDKESVLKLAKMTQSASVTAPDLPSWFTGQRRFQLYRKLWLGIGSL